MKRHTSLFWILGLAALVGGGACTPSSSKKEGTASSAPDGETGGQKTLAAEGLELGSPGQVTPGQEDGGADSSQASYSYYTAAPAPGVPLNRTTCTDICQKDYPADSGPQWQCLLRCHTMFSAVPQ